MAEVTTKAQEVGSLTGARIPLECAHENCSLPWGYVYLSFDKDDGYLMIVSRHNGVRHANVLSLKKIQQLLMD